VVSSVRACAVVLALRVCARAFKVSKWNDSLPNLNTTSIQLPGKKNGGRNASTWMDNIPFTHPSPHRDLCSISLSLSARKRFQINPPPLLFRSSFLKKEIKDDTVGISSSFASSQLCRIVSCGIVAVYVAV
jgi:hypothetical protein